MSAIQSGGGSNSQTVTPSNDPATQSASTQNASTQSQDEKQGNNPSQRAMAPSAFNGDVCACNPAVLHAMLANAGAQMEAWNAMNRLATQNPTQQQGYQPPCEQGGDELGVQNTQHNSAQHNASQSHAVPSGSGSSPSAPPSPASDPEHRPLTSSFSMPGETTATTSTGWKPPQTVEEFLDWVDAGEKATSLEIAVAATDMTSDEQLFARLALAYKDKMTGGNTINTNTVSQQEYDDLLKAYQVIHSAPEKRLAMTQEGDPNNFGFMLNMMDMFGDEYSLYDNFNTSVAGGDRYATRMSSFETLAAASGSTEPGASDVITVEDLQAIVAGAEYSPADKAFAQRLLDDPDLMAKLARYDTGDVQAIDKAGLMAMAKNYHGEMTNRDSGLFRVDSLVNYATSQSDVMDRTYVTWEVDKENQEILLDNGWKIKIFNEKSSWEIHDPEGNVAHVWGDPHIDLRRAADGELGTTASERKKLEGLLDDKGTWNNFDSAWSTRARPNSGNLTNRKEEKRADGLIGQRDLEKVASNHKGKYSDDDIERAKIMLEHFDEISSDGKHITRTDLEQYVAGGVPDGNARDFDIAHDWTFQAGGAKITVGTVGDNKWKFSDTLTITSEGGQSIEVKGIHSGNIEFVSQNDNGDLVGTRGAAADASMADGEWVMSGGSALLWYHDINRDGSLSEEEEEKRRMNENKYDERNGFWDKNRDIKADPT
jgi:hypothetical protein